MRGTLPTGVQRLLVLQGGLALLLSATALLWQSTAFASAAIGALIGCAGQAVLVAFAFRHRGARSAGLIARGMARGVTIKLVVIAALLAGVLTQTEGLMPLWAFVGLLVIQGTIGFFPLIDRRHPSSGRGAVSVRRDDD